MTSFAPRDWIEIFKNEIYKSVLLELPESFIDYLNSESIFDGDNDILSQLSETEDEALDSLDNTYDVQNPKILFPEIYESINNILNLFQTGCIPKLCSSSPKDSIWLTPDNSLRCRTASQIFHLLKASDRVSLEASKLLHNKDLLLVKWDLKFDPGQEFRAFVKDNHLLAICQRNDTVYYPHLEEIALKIIESISKYLLDRVYKKAPWSDCKFYF